MAAQLLLCDDVLLLLSQDLEISLLFFLGCELMPRSEQMPSVLLFQGARRFSNTFLKQKIVSDRTRGNNDCGPVHPWLAGFVSALNKEPWMSESFSLDFRNTIFSCTAPLVIPHNN